MTETISSSSFDPASAEHLRSTDPSVTMDIKLGRQLQPGQVLDVNYDNLRKTLDALRTPEDASDLQIEFSSGPKANGAEGGYNDSDPLPLRQMIKKWLTKGNKIEDEDADDGHAIWVRADTEKPEYTQELLQHELKHYADNLQTDPDENTELDSIKYEAGFRAGTLASRAMWGSVAIGLSSMAAVTEANKDPTPFLLNNDQYNSISEALNRADLLAFVMAVGSYALYAKYYVRDADERAARAAEKLELPPVLEVK
jgi:hypothetical protein